MQLWLYHRQKLECFREPKNWHSEHAVSVHPKKTYQTMKNIGHITDAFTKVVHGLKSVEVSSSDRKNR